MELQIHTNIGVPNRCAGLSSIKPSAQVAALQTSSQHFSKLPATSPDVHIWGNLTLCIGNPELAQLFLVSREKQRTLQTQACCFPGKLFTVQSFALLSCYEKNKGSEGAISGASAIYGCQVEGPGHNRVGVLQLRTKGSGLTSSLSDWSAKVVAISSLSLWPLSTQSFFGAFKGCVFQEQQ